MLVKPMKTSLILLNPAHLMYKCYAPQNDQKGLAAVFQLITEENDSEHATPFTPLQKINKEITSYLPTLTIFTRLDTEPRVVTALGGQNQLWQ